MIVRNGNNRTQSGNHVKTLFDLCIIKAKIMKTETSQFNSVLLTGTILLANIDVNGLMDYGLKATLGGAVWLCYKLIAEYIDKKKKQNRNEPK